MSTCLRWTVLESRERTTSPPIEEGPPVEPAIRGEVLRVRPVAARRPARISMTPWEAGGSGPDSVLALLEEVLDVHAEVLPERRALDPAR